ncbi:MAG TPA: ABC transporter ATP-binding protein [Planctomycetaceae bacterium]|nr:ABC transporter ATP-binding protein [Planctomycetaceae bacterium]
MSEPIIQAQRLTKVFGEKCVLNGVDLTVPRGAVVGLLGTNGAGKSTLIKCLLGLLRLSGGTASVFGEDPWNLSGAAKARLGYVPQDIRLYPWMRVRQVLSYHAAFYPRWDHALVEQLLVRWQLPREDRVGPLSPGQLQKLGLILALGPRPELLVLDEPVAALDPIARREFLRSLLEITQDDEHTVLFSTHITSDLERVASHVAILQAGRITLFDELDTVKDHVKRLRVRAASDLPPSFSVRGALRTEVSGPNALVAVANASDELLLEIRSQWQAEVTVEDLNLEDIFVELHQPSESRVASTEC